jgi:hypothetical protein
VDVGLVDEAEEKTELPVQVVAGTDVEGEGNSLEGDLSGDDVCMLSTGCAN